MKKIYIGIGMTRAQSIPAKVLRHSISLNTNLNLHFIDLSSIEDVNCESGKTPFSLQRFLFAEALSNEVFDIAIYLDSDMCVFSDIADLVSNFEALTVSVATCAAPNNHRRRAQSSVLVFNGDGARLLSDRLINHRNGTLSYEKLFYLDDLDGWGSLKKEWNCLEYYDLSSRLVHWTDMDSQPWLRDDHYLGGLWIHALRNWCTHSSENYKELIVDIKNGFIRPSLVDALNPPFGSHTSFHFKLKDIFFLPPHRFSRIPKPIRALCKPLLKIMINMQFYFFGKSVNSNNG